MSSVRERGPDRKFRREKPDGADLMADRAIVVKDSAGFTGDRAEDRGNWSQRLSVVGADGRLVGIVSDANLLLKEDHSVEP
jgi:CBS-domain-containing membrane protein